MAGGLHGPEFRSRISDDLLETLEKYDMAADYAAVERQFRAIWAAERLDELFVTTEQDFIDQSGGNNV